MNPKDFGAGIKQDKEFLIRHQRRGAGSKGKIQGAANSSWIFHAGGIQTKSKSCANGALSHNSRGKKERKTSVLLWMSESGLREAKQMDWDNRGIIVPVIPLFSDGWFGGEGAVNDVIC